MVETSETMEEEASESKLEVACRDGGSETKEEGVREFSEYNSSLATRVEADNIDALVWTGAKVDVLDVIILSFSSKSDTTIVEVDDKFVLVVYK